MNPRRGPIVAGEKIQFTDRKGKKITDQLTPVASPRPSTGSFCTTT